MNPALSPTELPCQKLRQQPSTARVACDMMDGMAHVKNIKPAARRFPEISGFPEINEFQALSLFLEAQ
jgi:hypothetical protein